MTGGLIDESLLTKPPIYKSVFIVFFLVKALLRRYKEKAMEGKGASPNIVFFVILLTP